MNQSKPFSPHEFFAATDNFQAPRVFAAPQRYIQGDGVLAKIGSYVSMINVRKAGILITPRGEKRHGEVLLKSLNDAGIEAISTSFGGECSYLEIDSRTAQLRDENIDCLIAVGGGKCVDTGKSVASRLGVPVIIAPTLASNDAPCSALSVIYSPEGASIGGEFFPASPALVVVDTGIIASASERFLVAGMGDAMATWYEAAVCLNNPTGLSVIGARPTLASAAIGQVCAETLFQEGISAAKAVSEKTVTPALEAVVEANTLLSGLGFESGGLAAAHGYAQSFTLLPRTHAHYLHGEMVAIGTLAQLILEERAGEARKVAEFFARVGLPVHLGQLGIDPDDRDAISTVVGATLAFPFINNMPVRIDEDSLTTALHDTHKLGTEVSKQVGSIAFERLHAV